MHILQITPQLPYPPDSGGRVAMFNFLQYLSQRHTITLLSFVTEDTERYVGDLERYCNRIVTVRHRAGSSKLAMLNNVVSSVPYTIDKFSSVGMTRQVQRLAESGRIDLAHIDHLHMAQYVHALPRGLPVVLREHNVESVIMRRFADQASNPLARVYAGLQARRLHKYESAICPRFDRCIAVTSVDGQALARMAPDARIEVAPDGVDTAWFNPAAVHVEPDAARLVTTGDYGWLPTADGLEYFVRDIYPHIRQAIPEVAFSVVGRRPPGWVVRMAREHRIDVIGRVEDIRPEILRGSVFVVPTRIGSGIRLKILEAMALRRPVVSTSIGCEGIEATPEEHLLVADDPAAFAGHVVRLLREASLRERLTEAAARLIEERYAWTSIAERLSAIYETILRERA